MAKIRAPRPEYIQIGGESNMVFCEQHMGAVYNFLSVVEAKFNSLVGGGDDPSDSPNLSYVDYLIGKLRLKESMGVAGEYLDMHVAPAHLDNFLMRMNQETGWRVADGSPVPQGSWFVKGGVTSLPDARGVFPRFWSNNNAVDKDGYRRQLGALQEDAMQRLTGSFFLHEIRHVNTSGIFQHYNAPATYAGHTDVRGENTTVTFDNARQARTSSETRPKNITVLRLILT